MPVFRCQDLGGDLTDSRRCPCDQYRSHVVPHPSYRGHGRPRPRDIPARIFHKPRAGCQALNYGFSLADKRALVKELENYARIFISSEIEISQDLRKYAINIPPHRMHDALYYASLLVGDTGTMVTEAGILGTPAITSHPKSLKMSNFIELERKYGLIFNIHESRRIIEKAVELLQRSDLLGRRER